MQPMLRDEAETPVNTAGRIHRTNAVLQAHRRLTTGLHEVDVSDQTMPRVGRNTDVAAKRVLQFEEEHERCGHDERNR